MQELVSLPLIGSLLGPADRLGIEPEHLDKRFDLGVVTCIAHTVAPLDCAKRLWLTLTVLVTSTLPIWRRWWNEEKLATNLPLVARLRDPDPFAELLESLDDADDGGADHAPAHVLWLAGSHGERLLHAKGIVQGARRVRIDRVLRARFRDVHGDKGRIAAPDYTDGRVGWFKDGRRERAGESTDVLLAVLAVPSQQG